MLSDKSLQSTNYLCSYRISVYLPCIRPWDSQKPPMTRKRYRPSTHIFNTDIQASDFSFKDPTELYCCVFSIIFVSDKTLFLRYFLTASMIGM